MLRGRFLIATIAVAGWTLCPPAAHASVQIGSTSLPAGAQAIGCAEDPTTQLVGDPGTITTVPTGGGKITQWKFATDDADLAVTLLVLRPSGISFQVVNEDTQDLPHTLPAGHLVTFTPSSPLPVKAGDKIGLYSGACAVYDGSAIPQSDSTVFSPDTYSTTPTMGENLTMTIYDGNEKLPLSATVVQPQDASVTAASAIDATTRETVQLVSTVHNSGPATDPIDLTDTVPAGLAVESVLAGQAQCSRVSHIVRCRFEGLGVDRSARVAITVAANKPGRYANHVSVTTTAGEPDPTPANNLATGQVNVRLRPCVVPRLAGAPVSVATQVLVLLGCRVGKLTHRYSSSVPKDAVVLTSPSAGTYRGDTRIAVTVSRGPNNPPHHHR